MTKPTAPRAAPAESTFKFMGKILARNFKEAQENGTTDISMDRAAPAGEPRCPNCGAPFGIRYCVKCKATKNSDDCQHEFCKDTWHDTQVAGDAVPRTPAPDKLDCGHGKWDTRFDCLDCLQFTVRQLNSRLADSVEVHSRKDTQLAERDQEITALRKAHDMMHAHGIVCEMCEALAALGEVKR